MHLLSEWFHQFLVNRSLSAPDCRPIYDYHFSRFEFETLQSLLIESIKTIPRVRLEKNIDFQRCLFLYAVMWVSFSFKEGVLKWSDIFRSIKFTAKIRDNRSAETDLVIKGAAYFFKKPKDVGHMNTGLVISQAGFPIAALVDASTRLTRLLQDVMAFDSLNAPTNAQLLYFIHGLELPLGYDEDTVAHNLLTGSRCFNEVIAKYRKGGVTEIQALHAKFRNEFPAGCISLEEFTKLLSDYQKAVEEKRRMAPALHNEAFRITRYLFVEKDSFNLRTTVSLNSNTTPDRIASFFNFSAPENRTAFGVVAAAGKPMLFVTISNGALRIAQYKKLRFDGEAALQNIDLSLSSNGRQYSASVPLNNTAQLQTSEVHYFAQLPDEDSRKWFYLGSGNLCTKALHVLALIPKHWDHSMLPDDTHEGDCLGFSVCRIDKDLTFVDPSDGCQFSLELGQEPKSTPQYMLIGTTLGYACDGTPIYRDIPIAYRYSAGLAVRADDIVWLDAGNHVWDENGYTERLRGRLHDNGRVVKRFNIITVPDNADLKSCRVRNHQNGEVRLVNWDLCSASLKGEDVALGCSHQEGADSVIEIFPTTDHRQDCIVLNCQTQSGANFDIKQPFPIQRSDFLLDGIPTSSMDSLSLTDAETLSARVIDMNPHSANYSLEIRPNNKYQEQEFQTFIPFTFVGNSKEATLSFADDMAQAVQRTLRLAGSDGISLSIPPGQHLQIQRHRTRLQLAETDGLLTVITTSNNADCTDADVIAIPLFNPEKAEPRILSREVEANIITIPLDMKLDQTTVWMLCRQNDEAFSTQPTFFAGPRDPRAMIKLATLLDLWVNDDPLRRDSRLREQVRDVVQNLIKHPDDPDWEALENIRQRTGVKGLARLPLWQALSDSVDSAFTLAILLDLRSGDRNHFLFNEVSKVQNWRWELNHLGSLQKSILLALKHMKGVIPISDPALFKQLFAHLLESRYFQYHASFEPKLKLAFWMNGLLDHSDCLELLPLAKLFNQAKTVDAASKLRGLWQQEAQSSSSFVIRDNAFDNKAKLALAIYLPLVERHFPRLHKLILASGILKLSAPSLTALFIGLTAWEAAGCGKNLDAKKQLAAAEPYFLLETLMSLTPPWTLACEKLAIAATTLI